jgi:outer membrane protein
MNYRLKLALGCILAVSANAPSYGANLLEVYQQALLADPLIHEADATRLATREGKPQAVAALLPLITGQATLGRSETTSDGSTITSYNPINGNPIVSTTSKAFSGDSSGWSISLDQPIFRWDYWVKLKRADIQVAQAEATYHAAEQDLIVRVMARYFAVLYAKDIVDTTDSALTAFTRQLEQSEKRFEVGLIAITDVQESRAQRDRASADLIDAKRTLATSHELLRELTGQDFETLAAPGDDMPLNPPTPAAVEQWINVAMEQNLSLISARLGAEIASKNVSIARSGHLPTLGLGAKYSEGDSGSTPTIEGLGYPTNDSSTTGKQIGLTLNVPIFAGGGTQSGVRQEVYNQRAARQRVERITRETERSVRDNFLGVMSNISRVQALKQAMESSQTSLQATQAGFEVGTRTTVDVLEGQRQLYSAQANYYKSRYEYLQTRVLLEQAAGQLNSDDLVRINEYLK